MIDFAVVGFQKCGTCSMRRWLREHPSVAVPDGEMGLGIVSLPWGPTRVSQGDFVEALSDESGDLIGAVDPTYTLGHVEENAIAMEGLNPDMKIIAIERDPVERAYSAWRMACVSGWEDRSFEEAIASCLEEGPEWSEAQWLRQSYVAVGEYDSIMVPFASRFDTLRLRLGDTEIVQKTAAFLGLEAIGEFPHQHRTRFAEDEEPEQSALELLRSYYAGRVTA